MLLLSDHNCNFPLLFHNNIEVKERFRFPESNRDEYITSVIYLPSSKGRLEFDERKLKYSVSFH